MTEFEIRKATEKDSKTILNIYKSVIGSEGCTWNNNYPGLLEVKNDISNNCLFVGTIDNEIMSAVSIVPENELDNLMLWNKNDGSHCEIARVAVKSEYQKNGYAKLLLQNIIEYLNRKKCCSIHLLVAKQNISAICLYKGLGFLCVGECHMYENDYYAYEKIID